MGLSKSAKRNIGLTLVVKPTVTTAVGKQPETVNQFWKAANPRSNGRRIARTNTNTSDALYVQEADKATYDRIKAYVAMKIAGFAVSDLPTRKPRILVRDVPTCLSEAEVVE